MGYAKEQAKAEIEKLVEDFKRNKSRLQNQAEAQIENNFIRPLFRYLNWKTRNEHLTVEQEMIQLQIDATDHEIDALVYELYDLTKEENE